MAAPTLDIYYSFRDYANSGVIDLESADIYLALVLNTYTKDLANTIWANVSTYEATTGNGYTTGGAVLTTPAVTHSTVTAKWDADDVVWASLTKTFRFGVLYLLDTVKGIVNPLIGIITFDSTPADIVCSGVDFTVQWNASGIFNWT